MAYKIGNDCVSCGMCVHECPCEAIIEGEMHLEIDQELCMGCGACFGVCPTGAIVEE